MGATYILEIEAKTLADAIQRQEQISKLRSVSLSSDAKPIEIPAISREQKSKSSKSFAINVLVEGDGLRQLEQSDLISRVWKDTPIAPFLVCNGGTKGDLKQVSECIGAQQVWSHGQTGEGIVVGIVDGGIDRNILTNTIDGSSPDWGTVVEWNGHGLMCGTDATGIAPSIRLYDMNIAATQNNPDTIFRALQAYDWARARFIQDGTPHILSNSWGIFQEAWDPDYATDPNHPFTRLVQEVIDLGIKVVFAAGNCGKPCGNSNERICGDDRGPGRDIWGANGLEDVMTIGAVKLSNIRAKYSSQGPAALHPQKPDFCGYTQFEGFYPASGFIGQHDGGTSAACPVIAGCVALLLGYDNSLTQQQLKTTLSATSKDLQTFGFDQNTGSGVIRIDDAFYDYEPKLRPSGNWRDRLCGRLYTYKQTCGNWHQSTIQTCSQWADQGSNQCAQWADEGHNECNDWRDEGYNNCSNWSRWFSWLCFAWVWVSSWVCHGSVSYTHLTLPTKA